ncbi:MAG: hypothetical protein ACLQVN_06945 [Bryobacteraceae bacterium]
MKKIVYVSILAFSFLTLASAAKSYQISLAGTTKVGSVELQPGAYAVKVQGSKAVFVNQDTNKEFTAPVKVENSSRKFEQTAVETSTASGQNVIQNIQLAGSKTQLDFSY